MKGIDLIITDQPKYGDWPCLKKELGVTIEIMGFIGPIYYTGFILVAVIYTAASIILVLTNIILKMFSRSSHPERLGLLKKRRMTAFWSRWKETIRSDEFQESWSWWLGTFLVTSLLILTWLETINIILLRNAMHRIAGSAWTEASWGFGQVLAIFIWLPVICQFVEETSKVSPSY